MIVGNEISSLILSPITAFIVVYISIPTIVIVAQKKHLFDEPGQRSAHTYKTPTLGGLAIFAGLLFACGLWLKSDGFPEFQYIVASIIVVFFVGIKDDILIIAPITKFLSQIAAALILIILANIRITSLQGFFGIHEISYTFSIIISLLIFLVIINGFNFIDGVDGLSASIGIITTSAFCYWFILVEQYQIAILSLSLIGALLAFFLFNVFGETNKIFMGDTGSLLIGLILSILVIHFNEFNIDKTRPFAIYPAPAVSFGVLIIPLFDLIRVVFIRILTRKPISKPDKNHLHHQLLELGLSHSKVTLSISVANLIFIYFVFYTSHFISIRRQLLLILILALVMSYIPSYFLLKKKQKDKINSSDSMQSNNKT